MWKVGSITDSLGFTTFSGLRGRMRCSSYGKVSITTKRGDGGETDLMFGKRVAKTSQRCAALGAVDELNAAIGLARAASGDEELVGVMDRAQGLLFSLMGQLACLPEDQEQYRQKGYGMIGGEDVNWVTSVAAEVEARGVKLSHWAVPGAEGSIAKAHLDYARTVCRRAEREVLLLEEAEGGVSREVRVFLNRVSDLMWVLARGGRADEGVSPFQDS